MADNKRYFPGADQVESLKAAEERQVEEREKRIEASRYEFHVDQDFDSALERIESFDKYEPFVPGEIRQYGDKRIYFRVFEKHFLRSEGYASLSVLMEESSRFGVDILAIASGAGWGLYNYRHYINEFKRHMGVEVPKESVLKKAKRIFFE